MKWRQPGPSRRIVGDAGGGDEIPEDGDGPDGGGVCPVDNQGAVGDAADCGSVGSAGTDVEALGIVGCSETTSVPSGANASASFEVFMDSGVSFTSEALVGNTRSGSTTQPGPAGFHTQLNVH